MYKIMFSAGETSGDMHGANLAKALKNICSDIENVWFWRSTNGTSWSKAL